MVHSTTSDNAAIDLRTETIDTGDFTVAAYSVNGGRSWKRGALPTDQARLSRLFNRGMTLWLAKELDGWRPVVDETTIKFPAINARPRSTQERLAPYYGEETWSLKTRARTEPTALYEWAEMAGRNTPADDWQSVPADGFEVLSGNNSRKTYLFRTPPMAIGDTFTPAGRPFRVKPRNLRRKTKMHEIKNETLTVRAGHSYSSETGQEAVTANFDLDTSELTPGTVIEVWKTATGDQPRSEKQELQV
jgi:hypothetical protein